MDPVHAYTPIPLAAIADLRTLTGDELKVIVTFCYYSFNQTQPQLTVERVAGLAGIAPPKIKPILYRLVRRGWLLQTDALYQLAQPLLAQPLLAQPQLAPSMPQPIAQPIAEIPPRAEVPCVSVLSPALAVRPARVNVQTLYPEGPWLTERGLLDEQFVRDRAEVWQKGN
ncbi:MAG: hypothetical protein VKJ24_03505, partial [Synechococcales bacterium]|nr:hypothetical protein [Synechococcales bacterium]